MGFRGFSKGLNAWKPPNFLSFDRSNQRLIGSTTSTRESGDCFLRLSCVHRGFGFRKFRTAHAYDVISHQLLYNPKPETPIVNGFRSARLYESWLHKLEAFRSLCQTIRPLRLFHVHALKAPPSAGVVESYQKSQVLSPHLARVPLRLGGFSCVFCGSGRHFGPRPLPPCALPRRTISLLLARSRPGRDLGCEREHSAARILHLALSWSGLVGSKAREHSAGAAQA